MKRFHSVALCITALTMLSACSERGTAPTGAPPAAAPAAERVLAVETPSTDFWWGLVNTEFYIDIDPSKANVISAGENRLTIPANSLCDVETTQYGPSEWDKPCTPETDRVRFVLKAAVGLDGHTRMDILPHARFSPSATPELRLFDPDATLEKKFEILWCSDMLDQAALGGCANEALTDPSLRTTRDNQYFFRKLKHFSGYEVAAT